MDSQRISPEKADLVYHLVVTSIANQVKSMLVIGLSETTVRDAIALALERGLFEYYNGQDNAGR